MKTIGILGASGFVGTALRELASASGYETVGFSRVARPGYRLVREGELLDLSGIDAVVNLAGEPILGLWTASKRSKILESRVSMTRLVVESLRRAPGVRALVNASAVGYYGETGENEVDESSPAGHGFLADTCSAWEEEAVRAEAACRVVRLRIGFVIGKGGAMRLVLPLFRLGLGGPLGDGRQWMSCVHVDDVAGMALWAAGEDRVSGPVNAVMPTPLRNADFTRDLGRAVHRPAVIPAPAPVLRIVMGGVSCVMLDSVRVLPRVALRDGYTFRHADALSALRDAAG